MFTKNDIEFLGLNHDSIVIRTKNYYKTSICDGLYSFLFTDAIGAKQLYKYDTDLKYLRRLTTGLHELVTYDFSETMILNKNTCELNGMAEEILQLIKKQFTRKILLDDKNILNILELLLEDSDSIEFSTNKFIGNIKAGKKVLAFRILYETQEDDD